MKLRLRSIESKETLRIQVPNLCSLHQLKQSLSELISASPSSLRVSLNRRDELHASSPDDSLASLGITSGDLIFYTLDPSSQSLASNSFSHPSLLSPNQIVPQRSNSPITGTLIIEGASTGDSMAEEQRSVGLNPQTIIGEGSSGVGTLIAEEPRSRVLNSQTLRNQGTSISEGQRFLDMNSETLIGEGSSCMDGAESMEVDDESTGLVRKKYSVPFFLRRVLREELAEDRSNHKLLVIALHAVLLESRFVRFDSLSGVQNDRFHLPNEWPTVAYTLSLSYTLPEILQNRDNGGGGIEAVIGAYLIFGALRMKGAKRGNLSYIDESACADRSTSTDD